MAAGARLGPVASPDAQDLVTALTIAVARAGNRLVRLARPAVHPSHPFGYATITGIAAAALVTVTAAT